MCVTYVILLSFLGLAIHSQAQNCPAPVPGANMKLKDEFSGSQTFQDGDKVSFDCDLGYTPAGGSSTITCTAGSWSVLRMNCEKKSCGSADEVANGNIDYSEGIDFGAKLVVTCNTGYRLVGKNEIFCGAQGWMDRMPECEVVICYPPKPVATATFEPVRETYEYGAVVQYNCPKGYSLAGSKSLSCSEDGTFKPAPPTCVNVQCNDPNIKNAIWVEGARPPYKYKSTVTYNCISGYTMTGERTQTCELDGQWSPGLPTCKPVQCGEPKIPNAERVDGSQPPYIYKSTVTFKCISGYTMSGSDTQICETRGQWSRGPTCKLIPTTTHPSTTKTPRVIPTTTQPSTTKTPRVRPDSTDAPPPGNNGDSNAIGLGVGLTFLIVVLTLCGCYFCGVPEIIKGKRRSWRSSPDDTVVPKEEEVALA